LYSQSGFDRNQADTLRRLPYGAEEPRGGGLRRRSMRSPEVGFPLPLCPFFSGFDDVTADRVVNQVGDGMEIQFAHDVTPVRLHSLHVMPRAWATSLLLLPLARSCTTLRSLEVSSGRGV